MQEPVGGDSDRRVGCWDIWIVVIIIDDAIVMAQTYDSCQDSIRYADSLFRSIGFYVNYYK